MTAENPNKYVPQLRMEKTGSYRDDFRVLIAGIAFCILLIMMQSVVATVHDKYFAERPFVSVPTLEIVHVSHQSAPLIKYDADATQPVTGTWIATIRDEYNTRLDTRRGPGNYDDHEDEFKLWSWSAWFDNEKSDPPAVPTKPFKVCVRYVVKTNDTGVEDNTKEVCSPMFDPNAPHPELTDILEKDIIQ